MPICTPPIVNEPNINTENCLQWVFQNDIYTANTVEQISVNARNRQGFNEGANLNNNQRLDNGNLILAAVQEILGAAPYNINGIIENEGAPENDVIYMEVCAALKREENGDAWDLHFNREYSNNTKRGASGGIILNNTYDDQYSILTVEEVPIIGNVQYANGVTFMLIPIPNDLHQGCQL